MFRNTVLPVSVFAFIGTAKFIVVVVRTRPSSLLAPTYSTRRESLGGANLRDGHHGILIIVIAAIPRRAPGSWSWASQSFDSCTYNDAPGERLRVVHGPP